MNPVFHPVEHNRKYHISIWGRFNCTVHQRLVEVKHQGDGRIGRTFGRETDSAMWMRYHRSVEGKGFYEQIWVELLLLVLLFLFLLLLALLVVMMVLLVIFPLVVVAVMVAVASIFIVLVTVVVMIIEV